MKNKISYCVICLFIIVLLLGCEGGKKEKLEVSSEMAEYLHEVGISEYCIEMTDDYRKITCEIKEKNITDEDRQQYIQNDLESHEITKEVKKRKVIKEGDVVTVSYKTIREGKEIEYVEEEAFMVGKGKFSIQIENELIGKEKGKEIYIDNKESNEVMVFIVKEIKTIIKYELNDEYVKKFYDFNSLDEYYEYVDEQLSSKNEYEIYEEEKQEVIAKAKKCFDITLDKEEVAKFSVSIIEEYEQMAYMYGLNIEQYYKEYLEITEENFMQKCYDEGEERIKEYVAIGAIAKMEEISSNGQGKSIEENVYLTIKNTVEFIQNMNGITNVWEE